MNEEQKVVSFTIEDCYHVCRLLYPDRSEKKKLKLAQRLHWKWQRRPPLEYQINEDSLTVSDKIILTKKNLRKCAVSGDFYFFQVKDRLSLVLFKPATEKHRQAMEDFLRINEIETLRELPAETSTLPWNEVYKMRVGSLLKRDFKKRRFFIIHALLILLLTFGCLIWNAKDYVNYILEDAGLSSAISERMMDTVFDSLPSDDIEILGQIQDKLQNSPAVDALAEKYAQAMIQGIASGKEFDEIHVDISNELVQIASTALTEIKKQIPLSDGMEKLITASLLSDSASAQSAINTYAEGIYDGFSNRLGGLVNLYRILTSQFMILFIALLYIGMVIACIATTPLTVVRFSYPTTFVLFGILYYFLVNVIGNTLVARLSNRFLGRTVFLDPSMGYAMLIVAILGAAFLFLCLTIRIKREEKKLTQL